MGEFREETIHHMGRRCREWDYSSRGIYMVTVNLMERGHPKLAEWPEVLRLAGNGEVSSGVICRPTPLGEKVLACWRRIPEFWPQVELIEAVVMPDHFHGILFVRESLGVSGSAPGRKRPGLKTLGDIIRGFKTGCREVGWEDGYVDGILFREGQLQRQINYIRDNPRRLLAKRSTPELFRRVEDLEVQRSPGNGRALHFQALGNTALLSRPWLVPVQCSRSDFAYRRERLPGGGWKILRDGAGIPLVEFASPAFEEKCRDALACAAKGAVLVSPCISHGEREIARRAHEAGVCVIALRNKGFAKYEKPSGALFDECAKGNLLLLAPAAWPYIPGEKPPTRETSLVLNRIAQLIAGENGPIAYRGVSAPVQDIDTLVAQSCAAPAVLRPAGNGRVLVLRPAGNGRV